MCGGTWYLSVYTTASTTLVILSAFSGLPYQLKLFFFSQLNSSSTWASQGCYVDESPRILQGYFGDQDSMTTESCISICSGLEFTMAATEYGSQCLCGNSLVGASPADSGDCSFPCAGMCFLFCVVIVFRSGAECFDIYLGNSAEVCGGNWRANVYTAPGVSV